MAGEGTRVVLPRGHLPALDGLRGLAILMVMIFHQTVAPPATAVDRAVYALIHVFGSGVDLFFVLSGFLITGILYDAKGTDRYFRNFFARRALRIFPLYYALLFAALVVLPRLPGVPSHLLAKWGVSGWRDEFWYWAYLSNWRIGWAGFHHGILDVSWSLAIEEQFYIVWPFVVAALPRRVLAGVCAGLIVVAFLARVAVTALGGPEMGMHTFTTSRMDTLAVGALIALVARGPGGLAALVWPSRIIGLAGAAWVAASVLTVGWPGSVAARSLGYSAMAAAYGALLVAAVAAPPTSRLARALTVRPLLVFGAYSYALYLFHYPILGAIRDSAYGPSRFPRLLGSPLPGQLLFYVVATLPALACAWASWHLFEKQFLKLKRFFGPGMPRTLIDPALDLALVPAPAATTVGPPGSR